MCKSFFRWKVRDRQQETCLGSEGCSPLPYSCRLQPLELFFRVFQASKAKPEAGVERRGGVKSTNFDQINEKRSPVTNKIQQNASISDSVIELLLLVFSRVSCPLKRIPLFYKYGSQ